MSDGKEGISRREFIKRGAIAASALFPIPRSSDLPPLPPDFLEITGPGFDEPNPRIVDLSYNGMKEKVQVATVQENPVASFGSYPRWIDIIDPRNPINPSPLRVWANQSTLDKNNRVVYYNTNWGERAAAMLLTTNFPLPGLDAEGKPTVYPFIDPTNPSSDKQQLWLNEKGEPIFVGNRNLIFQASFDQNKGKLIPIKIEFDKKEYVYRRMGKLDTGWDDLEEPINILR